MCDEIKYRKRPYDRGGVEEHTLIVDLHGFHGGVAWLATDGDEAQSRRNMAEALRQFADVLLAKAAAEKGE